MSTTPDPFPYHDGDDDAPALTVADHLLDRWRAAAALRRTHPYPEVHGVSDRFGER